MLRPSVKFYNVPSDFQLSDKEALLLAIARLGLSSDSLEETLENLQEHYAGLTYSQNCVPVFRTWDDLSSEMSDLCLS